MKVYVELEFLNLEQLHIVLLDNVTKYNKHFEANKMYLENTKYASTFLTINTRYFDSKEELIEYIEWINSDYHEMAIFILDQINRTLRENQNG